MVRNEQVFPAAEMRNKHFAWLSPNEYVMIEAKLCNQWSEQQHSGGCAVYSTHGWPTVDIMDVTENQHRIADLRKWWMLLSGT